MKEIIYSTKIDRKLIYRLKNVISTKKGYLFWILNSTCVHECDDYDYELICSEYEVIELSRGEWTCLINGAKFGNPYIVQPGR